MISFKLNKRFEDIPKSLISNYTCTVIEKIILKAPEAVRFSGYNSNEVRFKLKKYHGDKCVYCESIPIGSSTFRVDHFRPKRFIKGLDEKTHFGYYWLSLEWSNLVQSCESCNSKKGNQFPVDGKYVTAILKQPEIVGSDYRHITSDLLKNERRLLLHPELDDVESHLTFLPDGRVSDNNSRQGKESIEVYGLNRGGLIWKRKKMIDLWFNGLIDILNDYEDRGADKYALQFLNSDLAKYFGKLLRAQSEELEYSRLAFYIFHDFTGFILLRVPEELVEHIIIVKKLYTKLRNSI